MGAVIRVKRGVIAGRTAIDLSCHVVGERYEMHIGRPRCIGATQDEDHDHGDETRHTLRYSTGS